MIVNPVGPAGRMLGPDTEEVTATCTPNMIGGSLPGWVLEPPVDLMNVQCSRWECVLCVYINHHEKSGFLVYQLTFRTDSCDIHPGVLPFHSLNPKEVTFEPYLDYFGRPKLSLDKVSLGESIKIICLESGEDRDLAVLMISILMLYLISLSGALFEVTEGQGKYLLGRCAADGEGSPSWEWAMVEDSEQNLVFSNGTIPRCGG